MKKSLQQPAFVFVISFALLVFLVLLYADFWRGTALWKMHDSIQKQVNLVKHAASEGHETEKGVLLAHEEFLAAGRTYRNYSLGGSRDWVEFLAGNEREITIELLSRKSGRGIIKQLIDSRSDLLERNERHLKRLAGYRQAWVAPKSDLDRKIEKILDSIQNERLIIEIYDPASPRRESLINDFRGANDFVVNELVELWDKTLRAYLKNIPSGKSKEILENCSALIPQITSTEFPALDEERAALIGSVKSNTKFAGGAVEPITKKLLDRIDSEVENLEEEGVFVWERHDIPEVGPRSTPSKTLGEIIKCQQGLRLNGEEIFSIRNRIQDHVLPKYNEVLSAINARIAQTEKRVYFLFFCAILLIITGTGAHMLRKRRWFF
jgi:hypothetical protein